MSDQAREDAPWPNPVAQRPGNKSLQKSAFSGRRELAGGEPERAAATLREALALWRGAPLADLSFEPFTQTEIARLEELRLTALEIRIEADLALGRQDSLIAKLETLVAAHPYREGLRAQLMLSLPMRSSGRGRPDRPSGRGPSGSAIVTTTPSYGSIQDPLTSCRTIGLGVAPTDVEVGAENVWILSDSAPLRVDPASNDVVPRWRRRGQPDPDVAGRGGGVRR